MFLRPQDEHEDESDVEFDDKYAAVLVLIGWLWRLFFNLHLERLDRDTGCKLPHEL